MGENLLSNVLEQSFVHDRALAEFIHWSFATEGGQYCQLDKRFTHVIGFSKWIKNVTNFS